MAELFRRLRYLLSRGRFDRELRDDLEFHREMAAREGRNTLGNTLRLREEAREAWGWMWLDRCSQDLRYALRVLRRSPGFTAAAILMLAIGIGVNVAAFSFFNFLVLRPLPVRDPASLLRFHRHSPQAYAFALPYPELSFFREHSRTLPVILALNSARLPVEGEQQPLNAAFVSTNFFQDLGASPLLGRLLDPARDDAASAEPVLVLGYGFWQRHFGADPLVVGRLIRLNGKPVTIIGVAQREFSGLSINRSDFWAPLHQQPYFAPGSRLLTDFSVDSSGVQMFARLQPGIPRSAAEAELRLLAAELRKTHSADIWENETLVGEPAGYADSIRVGNRRGTGSEDRDDLYPVAALVGALCLLILTVACGNLGSLLLARGVAREREIAIRVSVGAGRGRLLRQLFTESLLLSVFGAAAGLALGYAVMRGLLALRDAPDWLDPAPDWRVALFALGTGILAALLFGLTPALQIARQRHRTTFLRQILVAAQVAASCVLLIVAGLLVRALQDATATNPGFEYRQVVSVDPGLAAHGYTPARARAWLDTMQARLRALPGVESVSLTDTAPLGNHVTSARVEVEGRRADILISRIDPEFFRTLKIPLLRGRNLTRGDTHAVVAGQSMAQRLWPGENPLGKEFDIDGGKSIVVGIAGSARLVRPEDPDMVEVYAPPAESDLPSMGLLVRTEAPPDDLARAAISLARSTDPTLFPAVQLLRNSFRRKLRTAESTALVVGILGLAAQLLACFGILGVVAYAVSQRVREIGIRLALGARPLQVISVVLRQFFWPVAAGLTAGLGGAAALSKLLRKGLYGVSNLDPEAYLAAVVFFALTVLLAVLFPAKRALKIDPARTLRQN